MDCNTKNYYKSALRYTLVDIGTQHRKTKWHKLLVHGVVHSKIQELDFIRPKFFATYKKIIIQEIPTWI